MTEYKHPMRDLAVIIYARVEGETGPEFIAKFEPFASHPIFFTGKTANEVRAVVDVFTAETIAKYEASFIARMEGREKAAASRARKMEAAQ